MSFAMHPAPDRDPLSVPYLDVVDPAAADALPPDDPNVAASPGGIVDHEAYIGDLLGGNGADDDDDDADV